MIGTFFKLLIFFGAFDLKFIKIRLGSFLGKIIKQKGKLGYVIVGAKTKRKHECSECSNRSNNRELYATIAKSIKR